VILVSGETLGGFPPLNVVANVCSPLFLQVSYAMVSVELENNVDHCCWG